MDATTSIMASWNSRVAGRG